MVVTLMLMVCLLVRQEYAIWPLPDENANLYTVCMKVYFIMNLPAATTVPNGKNIGSLLQTLLYI